ncbi:MAG TPA: nicotinate-nucleotide--dimethylbenzimidazole phosphoribosyltransferase [Gemmataceae bacterium]|nr:nicotinate-nucleotide--dimethylbenzimidazole phosphoribosyltransferase [Gemmataceae bacterium]
MTLLEQTLAAVVPVDQAAAERARERLDRKTKPRRSLGRLEDLAVRLAAIYRTADPPLPAKAVIVMAADHGVAEEGVSAYPQVVTAQMVANFAAGGAAINVLARQQGARVVVANMGTRCSVDLPSVRDCRLGPGTANFARGPAMSRDTAVRAVEVGIRLADELAAEGVGLLGIGEMGIGNTTAASAVTAVLGGDDPARVTGRGTGIDEERLRHKVQVIERALRVNRPDPSDALDVLGKVGGFEIAGLAGVVLGAAARRVPVILDGFITGAAALAAVRLCDAASHYLIASHRSVEPGHAAVLGALGMGKGELFDLQMRLGEGTGAVLAMGLAEAALRVLREMATFEGAGVTDAGA